MQQKALLELDIRIALLRDKMAAGTADRTVGPEIDRLVEQRISLLQAMAAAHATQRSLAQKIDART